MSIKDYIELHNINIPILMNSIVEEWEINLFPFKTIAGDSLLCKVGDYDCNICPLSHGSMCLASSYIYSLAEPYLKHQLPELFI